MNIQGLDYNTGRDKLLMPEYGREVQRMVQTAMAIDDRQLRQRYAENIVRIMRRLSPPQSGDNNAQQKYWDHLAIIADFKLDIDYPFDIQQARNMTQAPQRVPYPQQAVPVRHYGVMLFETFEKLKTMAPGSERNALVARTANQMKRCLVNFSHGSCDDEKVAADLEYFTDGAIQLDLDNFHFAPVQQLKLPAEKKRKKK